MKKIFLALMLLPMVLFCQPYQSLTRLNSTITLLDSAETFTGNIETISSDYNWIVVTVRSNIGGTGKVQFTNNNSTPIVWQNEKSFTYTAGDTVTNQYFFPVTMAYFRVVYTNDTTDQTSFRLTTVLIKNSFAPITNNKFDVNLTGGATSANQVIHNTKLDSIIAELSTLLTDADSSLILETARNILLSAFKDTNKVKLDALIAKDFATETSLASIIDTLSLMILQNTNRNLFLNQIVSKDRAGVFENTSITIDTTDIDSIYSSTLTSWYKVSASANDTVEYDFTSAFTNAKTLLPSTTLELPNIDGIVLDFAILPKIYWRTKGVGSPVLTYTLWGR